MRLAEDVYAWRKEKEIRLQALKRRRRMEEKARAKEFEAERKREEALRERQKTKEAFASYMKRPGINHKSNDNNGNVACYDFPSHRSMRTAFPIWERENEGFMANGGVSSTFVGDPVSSVITGQTSCWEAKRGEEESTQNTGLGRATETIRRELASIDEMPCKSKHFFAGKQGGAVHSYDDDDDDSMESDSLNNGVSGRVEKEEQGEQDAEEEEEEEVEKDSKKEREEEEQQQSQPDVPEQDDDGNEKEEEQQQQTEGLQHLSKEETKHHHYHHHHYHHRHQQQQQQQEQYETEDDAQDVPRDEVEHAATTHYEQTPAEEWSTSRHDDQHHDHHHHHQHYRKRPFLPLPPPPPPPGPPPCVEQDIRHDHQEQKERHWNIPPTPIPGTFSLLEARQTICRLREQLKKKEQEDQQVKVASSMAAAAEEGGGRRLPPILQHQQQHSQQPERHHIKSLSSNFRDPSPTAFLVEEVADEEGLDNAGGSKHDAKAPAREIVFDGTRGMVMEDAAGSSSKPAGSAQQQYDKPTPFGILRRQTPPRARRLCSSSTARSSFHRMNHTITSRGGIGMTRCAASPTWSLTAPGSLPMLGVLTNPQDLFESGSAPPDVTEVRSISFEGPPSPVSISRSAAATAMAIQPPPTRLVKEGGGEGHVHQCFVQAQSHQKEGDTRRRESLSTGIHPPITAAMLRSSNNNQSHRQPHPQASALIRTAGSSTTSQLQQTLLPHQDPASSHYHPPPAAAAAASTFKPKPSSPPRHQPLLLKSNLDKLPSNPPPCHTMGILPPAAPFSTVSSIHHQPSPFFAPMSSSGGYLSAHLRSKRPPHQQHIHPTPLIRMARSETDAASTTSTNDEHQSRPTVEGGRRDNDGTSTTPGFLTSPRHHNDHKPPSRRRRRSSSGSTLSQRPAAAAEKARWGKGFVSDIEARRKTLLEKQAHYAAELKEKNKVAIEVSMARSDLVLPPVATLPTPDMVILKPGGVCLQHRLAAPAGSGGMMEKSEDPSILRRRRQVSLDHPSEGKEEKRQHHQYHQYERKSSSSTLRSHPSGVTAAGAIPIIQSNRRIDQEELLLMQSIERLDLKLKHHRHSLHSSQPPHEPVIVHRPPVATAAASLPLRPAGHIGGGVKGDLNRRRSKGSQGYTNIITNVN